MKRTLIALLLIVLLSLPLTSALAQDGEGDDFVCPNTGGTLVVAYGTDPRTLSGLYASDGNSLFIVTFMAEPLLLGGENWGDQIEPALAESWDISEDGLEYTFHLRQGVKWHDGEPFTAEDVLFTYEAVLLEENAIDWRTNLMQGDQPMQFEVVDDYTFKVKLSEADATVLTALAIPIVPKHAFTSVEMLDAPYNTNPVATGPFKFVEWNTGENVVLEANQDYWRGAPCIDRLVVRFIEGAANQANALLAGELDYARVDGADLTPFENNPDFVLATAPRDLMRYVGFNVRSPKVSDPAVRRALAVALDRQAIIDAAAGGYGTLADSVFTSAAFMYEPGRNEQYPYDPALAQQMLADAGWTDTDGDGIVDKDGEKMSLRVVYLGTWSLMQAIAPLVYDNWRSVGVDVMLEPLDEAKSYEEIYDNVSEEKPYDVMLGGWGLFGPEPDHYRNYLVSPTGFFAYDNEEVQAMFEEGRRISDPEARYELYAEVDRLLWEDLPMIPLYQAVGAWVYRSDLNIDAAELNGTFLTGLKYPGRAYFVE
ncbi:MAG TPA: ABC transporter substrate-binding protein [Aggregatilineaceae bacterium]|jgi:peptide/nickel transport system substrate-binding protein|nr:ABC transporter substrate-binding protein [Anaerolineae bacterium]HMM27989.1 ABC transporter substrate-binding protein [Aggregatilineaceae bacterium]